MPPATPPKKAPIVKASTFERVVLTPMDSAAISSSRTAMASRPWRERTKLRISMTEPTVRTKNHVQSMYCGTGDSPAAPLVNSKFCSRMRMISAMPRVAMAR